MITDRNLKAGTKLVAHYHKQSYTCEVVEVEGKLRYRLADGREFKTPSGAGMAVTLHACDGWHFWSVETAQTAPAGESKPPEAPQASQEASQPAAEVKAETPEQSSTPTGQANPELAAQAKEVLDKISESLEMPPTQETQAAPATEGPGPAKKRIFRLPNQKGVPEGKVCWYCHDCGKSFLTAPGETPQTCPEGHKIS